MRGRYMTGVAALAAVWIGMSSVSCSTNTKDIDEVAKDHPPVSQGQQAAGEPAPADAGGTVVAVGLSLPLPEGWEQMNPSSSMRAAQFRLPASEPGEKDGEVAVFHFGAGGGGDVQANLQRWAGQFPQEDDSDPMSRAKIDEFTVGNLKVTTITLNGRYQTSGMGATYDEPDWRLLGAIVEGEGGPWFLKGVGPKDVMTTQEKAFMEMLRGATL